MLRCKRVSTWHPPLLLPSKCKGNSKDVRVILTILLSIIPTWNMTMSYRSQEKKKGKDCEVNTPTKAELPKDFPAKQPHSRYIRGL